MRPVVCTMFDRNYLTRGLALVGSLQQHQPDTLLYVLALDPETAGRLRALDLDRVRIQELAALEVEFAVLPQVRKNRTWQEYCWTLTPFWIHHVMSSNAVSDVVYVDADSYLFGSLDPFYEELADSAIGIVPHRFPPALAWREQHNGRFNVNCVLLRDTAAGRRCLTDWCMHCAEWCYARTDRAADGSLLFGDQGYLDSWVERYGAHVVEHIGVNLAPWNQVQYEYVFDERLYVVQKRSTPPYPGIAVQRIHPLLLYHFHGVALVADRVEYGGYAKTIKKEILEHVYTPYIERLRFLERSMAVRGGRVGAAAVG